MAEQQAEVAWIDLGAADSLMVPALRDGARQLVANAVRLAQDLIQRDASQAHIARGGRKAHNPAAAPAPASGAE